MRMISLREGWNQATECYALNPEKLGNRVLIIRNLLTEGECQQIIDVIDSAALIPGSAKTFVRDNYVTAVDDEDASSDLFDRITASLRGAGEDTIRCNSENASSFLDNGCGMKGLWELHSLNPTLELVKYFSGGHFAAHYDGDTVVDAPTLRSFKTFMVYLNDEYDGGETNFGEYEDATDTKPHISKDLVHTSFKARRGDCIIFDHKLWHEGQSVREGRKYLIKSNLMYRSTVQEPDLSLEAQASRLYYEGVAHDKEGLTEEAISKYRKAYKLCPAVEEFLY